MLAVLFNADSLYNASLFLFYFVLDFCVVIYAIAFRFYDLPMGY